MSRARPASYGAPMNDTSPPASGAGSLVAPTSTRDADGLTVADVMHAEVGSLPPSVTVDELRDWFAVSASRRRPPAARRRRRRAPARRAGGHHRPAVLRLPAGVRARLTARYGVAKLRTVPALVPAGFVAMTRKK
jgi:hypothetical protein